jgi:hypothetical protein
MLAFRSASNQQQTLHSPIMTSINYTERGLIETLLWCSIDGDEPLDKNYDISNIAASDIERLSTEFYTFREAADAVAFAVDMDTALEEFGPLHHDVDSVAYDYILTRNHHGAGFWDGDWAEIGDQLTELAQKLPEIEPYVGDDGVVYLY